MEVPLDPDQNIRDMNDPNFRLPEQMRPAGPGGTFSEEQAAELSGILVPTLAPLDIAAATGLPRGSRPYKITMQQAFTLALINSRFYQTQPREPLQLRPDRHAPAVRLRSRSSTRACRP